jgi:hypothetical protein
LRRDSKALLATASYLQLWSLSPLLIAQYYKNLASEGGCVAKSSRLWPVYTDKAAGSIVIAFGEAV